MLRIMLTLAILAAGPAAARAQAEGPDTEGGRYQLRRVDDGLMRLDRQTGAVSFCRRRQAVWLCEAVPDDRRAMEDEVDRLSRDNSELAAEIGRLKQRVAELEALAVPPQPQVPPHAGPQPAPPGPQAEAPPAAPEPPPALRMPSDQEIDQVMQSFESMMRRFLDMVRDLRRDYEERT